MAEEFVIRGGMSMARRFWSLTWPFARLSARRGRVILEPGRVWRLFLPGVAFNAHEVTLLPGFQQVRFVPSDTPEEWVAFLCFRPKRVVRELGARGFVIRD